jgi:hypothetical protein
MDIYPRHRRGAQGCTKASITAARLPGSTSQLLSSCLQRDPSLLLLSVCEQWDPRDILTHVVSRLGLRSQSCDTTSLSSRSFGSAINLHERRPMYLEAPYFTGRLLSPHLTTVASLRALHRGSWQS